MSNFVTTAIAVVLSILLVLGIYLGFIIAPLWVLWNWLMPVLFGLPVITFGQAIGLSCLSMLIIQPWFIVGRNSESVSKSDKKTTKSK